MSWPTFAVAAEDWPILELGSALLAFVRDGDEGKLVLVIGEKQPEMLPYSFKVDAEGRAIEPVELEVSLHAKGVSVSCAGEVHGFPYESGSSKWALTVSSGASQTWAFDRFTIETPDATDTASEAGRTGRDGPKTAKDKPPSKPQAGEGVGGSGTQSTGAGSASDPARLAAGAGSLEVFTPPSVRSIRARIEAHLNKNSSR